jgi:hypothetical protein
MLWLTKLSINPLSWFIRVSLISIFPPINLLFQLPVLYIVLWGFIRAVVRVIVYVYEVYGRGIWSTITFLTCWSWLLCNNHTLPVCEYLYIAFTPYIVNMQNYVPRHLTVIEHIWLYFMLCIFATWVALQIFSSPVLQQLHALPRFLSRAYL